MRPAQAITTGFARSFRFSGRASRAEFWWFAPVGALPPLAVGLNLEWFRFELLGIWRVGILALASLPLMAATSRRLQDMGEPGHQAAYPFMPFVILWVGYHIVLWGGLATWFTGLSLLLLILAYLLLVPLYLATIFVALLTTASVIGMLLVPGDPNPNRYGPVPV